YLDTWHRTACLLYPYPSCFSKVTFPSLDGTPLAGMLALHNDGAAHPGLIFCHGLLGSKNQMAIHGPAMKAYRDWGYNVLTLDLRAFGESRNLSDALPTGGWKEGEDIIGAARYLGSFATVTSVGVSGYSMGAGSALVAAGMDAGEHINGGVIAWNGFADTRRMMQFIGKIPLPWQPYALIWPVFRSCFLLKMRDMGIRVADFEAFIRFASQDYYEVPEDELYELASPRNYLGSIRTPTIHIHAADDPVVPLLEAEENAFVAEGNPYMQVWVLKRGGHCSFHAVDKRWYERVMHDFFGALALSG
ncbi:MAG: alpha/beta hydrolase, partial [Candidatus Geothermincolia bacterium]